jgi:hypothetical protein
MSPHVLCATWNEGSKGITHLKLVTHTERMPASAAARHATGTTSETCQHFLDRFQSLCKVQELTNTQRYK